MPRQITIRFYEELNDFLPKPLRKQAICRTFMGTPPVRDLIEAMGIPHTEVDLILANGNPVGFYYRPSDGDYISVYPNFESLDISGVTRLRPMPLRITRFILDVHLGKLARYLRMFGFDTLYRNDFNDREIIDISVSEHRIILTRDRQLLKNSRVTHGYCVHSDRPLLQVREVISRFDLRDSVRPFRLCLECNGPLAKISEEEASPLIEEGTRRYHHEFYRCTSCRRIYWEGSHYKRMIGVIEGLLEPGAVKPGLPEG